MVLFPMSNNDVLASKIQDSMAEMKNDDYFSSFGHFCGGNNGERY